MRLAIVDAPFMDVHLSKRIEPRRWLVMCAYTGRRVDFSFFDAHHQDFRSGKYRYASLRISDPFLKNKRKHEKTDSERYQNMRSEKLGGAN
jgi:hypothetical protein